jgi:hypothetical protein
MEIDFSNGLGAGLVITICLAAAIFVMILCARWARRRSKGVVATGALLSAFAPDPTFEKNIRLVEEAKRIQSEEDEEGEGKDV